MLVGRDGLYGAEAVLGLDAVLTLARFVILKMLFFVEK